GVVGAAALRLATDRTLAYRDHRHVRGAGARAQQGAARHGAIAARARRGEAHATRVTHAERHRAARVRGVQRRSSPCAAACAPAVLVDAWTSVLRRGDTQISGRDGPALRAWRKLAG